VKCLGFGAVAIFFLIFATWAIIYDFHGQGYGDEGTPVEVSYQIQQVLQGRLISLSKNGLVAAIQDDFDYVQMYRKRNTTETTTTSPDVWQPTGAPLRPRGTVCISRNGTLVAFVDETTKRPEMWEYDPSLDEWNNREMPFAIGDDLSMDPDALLLILAVYNRGAVGDSGASLHDDMDALITFKYDGTIWTEHADRILISGITSFEVSPTARFMVICAQDEEDEGDTTEVHIFRLAATVGNGNVFERVDHVVTVESSSPSVSLANDVFAVASPELLEVFSYSGRTWGQALEPRRENATIASVALSLDGRTLAVGSVTKGNNTGAVDWLYFPFNYDTGDDWEIKGPPLTDEWELGEPPLRDAYGNESPVFGSEIELDGNGTTIAVQSGTTGNENVHFYDVLLP
jgi:hypothetical protein